MTFFGGGVINKVGVPYFYFVHLFFDRKKKIKKFPCSLLQQTLTKAYFLQFLIWMVSHTTRIYKYGQTFVKSD
jgi:hypothetical protein